MLALRRLYNVQRLTCVMNENITSGVSNSNSTLQGHITQQTSILRCLVFLTQAPRKRHIRAALTSNFFTSSPLNKLHQRMCWKCGGDTHPEKELFFCVCGVVQKPAKCATFYELLQIEPSFDVDTSVLSKRFKDTQRLLHPDKFSTKSKEEHDYAEEQSSLLNKCYETLLKPLSRSIYLLELEDVTISENDSMSDPEFLISMMEDFETISSASNPDDVASLEENNNLRIEKCVKDLSKAFSESDLINAKNLTIQLRYYTTILDRIKELRLKSFCS